MGLPGTPFGTDAGGDAPDPKRKPAPVGDPGPTENPGPGAPG